MWLAIGVYEKIGPPGMVIRCGRNLITLLDRGVWVLHGWWASQGAVVQITGGVLCEKGGKKAPPLGLHVEDIL
jgi:hypothetical protein